MGSLFASLYDLRPGEKRLAGLMFANHFLILTALYLLKPARDSLFLSRLGSEQLPWVFIIIAAVGLPVGGLLSRFGGKLSVRRLTVSTGVVLAGGLVLLRLLVDSQYSAVYYALYVWVAIYGIVSISQFWLTANSIYDAAQARRVFPLLGLGGLLGAIVGGLLTSWLTNSDIVATHDLLLFGAGAIALSAIVTVCADPGVVAKAATVGSSDKDDSLLSSLSGFDILRESKYLRMIVAVVGISALSSGFVDYLFKTVASTSLTNENDLTAFLGVFYGALSIASVLLQLVLTGRVLKALGVGALVIFLPIGLLLGSTLFLLVPGLVMVTLMRGLEGSLSYSADKTGRELLFLPVPLKVKKRVKVLIDLIVDRWAQGLAGILLIVAASIMGLGTTVLTLVVLGLIVLWIGLTLRLRRGYVEAFRVALERREIDPADLEIDISDESTVDALLRSIRSENEREVLYALKLIRSVKDERKDEAILPLLDHQSGAVRSEALRAIEGINTDAAQSKVRSLLDDSDRETRLVAWEVLLENEQGDDRANMEDLLRCDDSQKNLVAFELISRRGNKKELEQVDSSIVEKLIADYESSRDESVAIAHALGNLQTPELYTYLIKLASSNLNEVRTAAFESMGKTGSEQFIDLLIQGLAEREVRAACAGSLIAHGPSIVPRLKEELFRTENSLEVRRTVSRILGRIPSQKSCDLLCDAIEQVDPGLREPVIRALNSLHSRYPDLRLSKTKIRGALLEESSSYLLVLESIHAGKFLGGPGSELLTRLLQEELQGNFERVFRLLGLKYPPHDIYNSFQAISGQDRALRANAYEFLSNLLDVEERKCLLYLFDDAPVESILRRGRELHGLPGKPECQLQRLVSDGDPWLGAVAMYVAIECKVTNLKDILGIAAGASDPMIAEVRSLAAAGCVA